MMLILFWITFLMFYFSYLFSVMFLVMLVFLMLLVYSSNFFFLKFLVILVYVSGVVVFMLYISCMCWYKSNRFSYLFLFFGFFNVFLWDEGLFVKFSDVGTYLWMFLFIAFIFNILVYSFSLVLYKSSGSLRF